MHTRAQHLIIATLALFTLAACSDSPTAALPAAPAMARVPHSDATVTMNVRDRLTSALVGGATVEFSAFGDIGPTTIADNGAGDADKRDGYFTVTLRKSTGYTGRVLSIAGPKYDSTMTKQLTITSSASKVDLGTDSLYRNPLIVVSARAAVSNALLGGAAYSVALTDFPAWAVYTDDQAGDVKRGAGVVGFYGRGGYMTTVCEVKAPPLYSLPTPSCQTLSVLDEMEWPLTFLHDVPR